VRLRVGIGLAVIAVGVAGVRGSVFNLELPSHPAVAESDAVIMAAGDIASCDVHADALVGSLVGSHGTATVAALGDLVYPAGTAARFRACYHEAWGGVRDRTRPTPGNHDIEVDGGVAYFEYFGGSAGTPGEGWYAYDAGSWRVVVLNTNCRLVQCEAGSPQHEWLQAELDRSDARCTLAYFHHPITGSGMHGRYPLVDPLWAALTDADVDLVLAGHEHHYERFGPLDAEARPNPDGIPMIIVGTGGIELRRAGPPVPGSEELIDGAFGALRLTLQPDGYSWAFLALEGGGVTVRDSGSGSCR